MSTQAAAFSQLVASDEWRSEAIAWIDEVLTRDGYRIAGPVSQPRIRPWSTQLVVPTDHGRIWFKACCPSMRFEPTLQRKLAELAPRLVQRPLGVDTERGWLLTADHGPTMDDEPVAAAPATAWSTIVRRVAELQLLLAGHREELLATGLPDCSPATVPARFDGLLDALESLPPTDPHRLDAAEAARFRARRGELLDACQMLDESPFRPSFQHGDLHLDNVYGSVEDVRLFDFGDAQWAAAVEVMAIPYAVCQQTEQFRWPDLVASYLDVWNVDHTAWGVAWNASTFTHPVNRALTWWECLRDVTAEEWAVWGEAPLGHLREMMAT